MSNIAAAFVKAKRTFGPALKDKKNQAFKSKYADLGACFDAVDGPCLDQGIAIIQETFEDATGVTVETVFLHESGESIRCGRLHVPAAKHDPQGFGSALTYARRYSLLTACGIAPEDDDGNAAAEAQRATHEVAHEPAKLTPEQVADWRSAIDSAADGTELANTAAAALEAATAAKDREAFVAFRSAVKARSAGVSA